MKSQKQPLSAFFILSVCLVILIGCDNSHERPPIKGRWYTQSQLDMGQAVYTQHCQVCHGTNGEGTPQWREKLSDGSYPPPPLNGTAHTWHHSLRVLMRTLENGGKPLGGSMPGFKDTLSSKEQLAVIAYVQQFWTDEIYETWLQRGGLK